MMIGCQPWTVSVDGVIGLSKKPYWLDICVVGPYKSGTYYVSPEKQKDSDVVTPSIWLASAPSVSRKAHRLKIHHCETPKIIGLLI